MSDQTPTAEEAFGSDVPTADEAFGPETPHPGFMGKLSDTFFSQGKMHDRLDKFGQGVKQGWGSEPFGISPETTKELQKYGIFDDYSGGRANLLKQFNESLIRPAVTAVQGALRTGSAIAGGFEAAVSETGKQIGAPGLGQAGAGIIEKAFTTGEPELLSGHELTRARAEGVIGEPEHGYFGTGQITDAQQEARNAAVGELQVQGKPLDIHTVAQQIAPETFAHYDALTNQQSLIQRSIRTLQKTREEDPDVLAAQKKISDILDRVNGNEEELSDKAQEELSTARDGLQAVHDTSTPEIEDLRASLNKINDQLSNLAPDVKYAYSEAYKATAPEGATTASQMPTTAPTEPVQAVPGEPGTQVAPVGEPAVRPSEGLSGQIASDASKRLQTAGRPLEEADAVGQLIEAHYNSRADRFKGALGPGKDLYDRDFPELSKTTKFEKGRTLNQGNEFEDATKGLEFPDNGPPKLKSEDRDTVKTPLVVARKLPDGTIRYGKPGDIHSDLIHEGEEPNGQAGFAKHVGGEFLTREEAAALKKQEFQQGQRGSITIREGRNLIRLFKDADASTFLHETGHQWLEEMAKDAEQPEAPTDLKQDLESVRKYVKNTGGKFTRAQHEKFARSFERYLMEGRAPTKGLQAVFEKFKKWLTEIYQKIGALKAPINNDIRQVFDRLINTPSDHFFVAPDRELRVKTLKSTLDVSDEEARKLADATSEASPERSPTGVSQPSPATPVAPQEAPGQVAPTSPTPETTSTASPEEPTSEPVTKPTPPPQITKGSTTPLASTTAGNIRIENVTDNAGLTEFIRQTYEQNKAALDLKRGKISDSDVLDLADIAGLKTSDINVRLLQKLTDVDGIPLSVRVYGLRQAFLDSSQKAWEIMRAVPPDEEAYAQATTRHLWIQSVLTGTTSEAGRILRAFQNLNKATGASKVSEATRLAEFFQSQLGKSLEQIQKEMKLGAGLKNPSQVSGFITQMQKPSLGEMGLEVFRNWLISGPITHMTYAAGNKIFALYKAFPETLARAAVGAVHEKFALPGIKERLAREKVASEGINDPERLDARIKELKNQISDEEASKHFERVYAGEAGEGLYAMLYGQRDGMRAAWESFKVGQTLPLPGEDLANTPFTRTKAVPSWKYFPLGDVVRAPGERMVAPIHSFDRTVGYLTNRAQLIYRKAYSEGLRGDALSKRIAELEQNTPEDIMKEARGEASDQALMGRPGAFTRKFLNVVRHEINLPLVGRTQPLSFAAPFVSVVSNINKQGLIDRTIFGGFSEVVRDNLSGKNGVLAQDTTIAKLSLGTAFAGTVGSLFLEGIVTPGAPKDYHQATVEEMVSGIPHSVRIGDMSYQFNRLGVVGLMASVATDVFYAGKVAAQHPLEFDSYSKASAVLIHAMGETFTQEGMMSGISDLLNAIEDKENAGQSYVKNMLATAAVPFSVGMSQVARLVDPTARDAHGVLQSMIAKIPYLSETLEPRVDVFGQDIPNKEYWGVYAEQVKNDPVAKAFKDNGYFPAPVEKKIAGVELSPEQYHQYAQKAGMLAKLRLNILVGLPGFNQLSTYTKHEMMQEAVTGSRSAAAQWLMAQPGNTDIMKKATKLKQDLRQGTKSE